MKIEFREITVRDLAADYIDNKEAGVVGYGGQLDIRPPYHQGLRWAPEARRIHQTQHSEIDARVYARVLNLCIPGPSLWSTWSLYGTEARRMVTDVQRG